MPAHPSEDNPLTLVDGVQRSSVCATDRGLQFGDGFFETLLCYDGGIPLKTFHWRRLDESSRRLGFNLSLADVEQYLQQFLQLRSGRAPTTRAAIKIIITRGVGGRGYIPPSPPRPSVIITARPVTACGPIVLKECETRLSENPTIAGLKHLNRLEYCLAGRELSSAEEGLLISLAGQVVETLHHNIFWTNQGVLYTPSLQTCGVRGVLRQYLLDVVIPRLGLTLIEIESPLERLAEADEIFACNAVRGVRPVHALASKKWSTGPVTKMILAELKHDFGDAFF